MAISTASGTSIYYEVSGDGPALLLIHANPFDHRLWVYQAAHFSSFFTVISMDLRGYGRSAKASGPVTIADLAGDALGVCADIGVDSAMIGGVSVGSGVALFIGQNRPEFTRALVLVGGRSKGGAKVQDRIDGYLGADLAAYRRQHIIDCFAPGFAGTSRGEWVVNMFADTSRLLSGRSIARIFEARASCDMSSGLAAMRMPVLVVNGEHDRSLASGRETARSIPGAEHVVVSGAGHACCIEEPAAFDAAVIGFLQRNGLWPTGTAVTTDGRNDRPRVL